MPAPLIQFSCHTTPPNLRRSCLEQGADDRNIGKTERLHLFHDSGMRARGTGQAVLTGSILTPLEVSHRTVVVMIRRGAIISCRAKASPFGHRAPLTSTRRFPGHSRPDRQCKCTALPCLYSEAFPLSCAWSFSPLASPSRATVSQRSSQLLSILGHPVDQVMYIVGISRDMDSISGSTLHR